MIVGQSVDVLRVIEQTFPLSLNVTGIVLPETLQARSPEGRSVGAPVSGSELTQTISPRANAAVDHRNEMTVGHQIQNIATPRPIYAREEHIAVKRRPVASLFIDRRCDRMHVEARF